MPMGLVPTLLFPINHGYLAWCITSLIVHNFRGSSLFLLGVKKKLLHLQFLSIPKKNIHKSKIFIDIQAQKNVASVPYTYKILFWMEIFKNEIKSLLPVSFCHWNLKRLIFVMKQSSVTKQIFLRLSLLVNSAHWYRLTLHGNWDWHGIKPPVCTIATIHCHMNCQYRWHTGRFSSYHYLTNWSDRSQTFQQ